MGQLSKTVTSTPLGKTTLHLEVESFARKIAFISCLIGLITFFYWLGYVRKVHPDFMNLASMLVNVISVVVCFVPEVCMRYLCFSSVFPMILGNDTSFNVLAGSASLRHLYHIPRGSHHEE